MHHGESNHAQEFHFEAIKTIEEDKFCFKIEVKDKPQTRRSLLSVVCLVYDPLHCAASVILPTKLMLLDLCQKKNPKLDDPDFLWSQNSTWPVQLEMTGQVTKDDPEVNSQVQTLLTAADKGTHHVNQLLEHKIIVWNLRYREMLRAACTSQNKGSEAKLLMYKQVNPFSVVEIEKAEKEVFKVVQWQSFREEVSQVDESKNRSEDSRHRKERVSQLQIFPLQIEQEGNIQRLQNMVFSAGRKTYGKNMAVSDSLSGSVSTRGNICK